MKLGISLLSTIAAALLPCVAIGDDIYGDWSGQLRIAPQMSLKLNMHISEGQVTLDSPDQGAFGIPAEIVFLSLDSISLTMPPLRASYSGKLNETELTGVFMQGGIKFPLNLQKGVAELKRPQTPQPPFAYTMEEVTVPSEAGVLNGTLTVPANAGAQTPLVVMISGSGLQNRDEEIFGHKPFAVIADYLANHGIASFRYDDRGVGASSGDGASASLADFTDDAKNVVSYFRERQRFGNIGVLGHSEGGLIAYTLGAQENTPDFLISIAGPSLKGSLISAYQNRAAMEKLGLGEKYYDDYEPAMARAFEYLLAHEAMSEVADDVLQQIYPQCNDDIITRSLSIGVRKVLATDLTSPEIRSFIEHDPAEDLARLRVPALLIYGGKDRQVPALRNKKRAEELLKKGNVRIYSELNHLMQHAITGEVGEYQSIEETIAPEVLEDIVAFVTALPLR